MGDEKFQAWKAEYEAEREREREIEKERKRRWSLTAAQRAYEDTYGREAQERQTRLAAERWPCCGNHRDDGHHDACSERPDEPEIAVHDDQEALL